MVNFSDTKLATKQDLKDMYDRMYPYLGGMPEVLANKFSKGDMYSTDEKMIGQWIDGKPLYQKTFIGTSTSGTYHIDISDLNVDTPVDIAGYCKIKNGSNAYIFGGNWYRSNADSIQYYVSSDKTKIGMDSGTTYAFGEYRLTFKYTKTTDSPISIGDDTDYSTEEKIVGTWITGEPIYQKTIQTTAPNCVTYGVIVEKAINLNVALDKIIKVEGFVYDSANYVCMPINSALQNSKDAVYMIRAYCYGNGAASNPNSIVIGNSIKDYNDKPCYVTIQYTKITD